MARLHPNLHRQAYDTFGARAELRVLDILEQGLDGSYDIFHGVDWSTMYRGDQRFGEIDVVVVSPSGHVLLMEVKSGELELTDGKLYKVYENGRRTKDVAAQTGGQHSAMLSRLPKAGFPNVHVGHLLVMPDYTVRSEVLAFPPERVVDTTEMDVLCTRVIATFTKSPIDTEAHSKLLEFFKNEMTIEPDVSARVGLVEKTSRLLASGLATWVPRISHAGETYIVNATAGSGKTQLALKLLKDAVAANQRACYVCFNRPLADHMISVAPPAIQVSTFHELARELYERQVGEPDFTSNTIFQDMLAYFIEHAAEREPWLDLLVIDESQDFDAAWVLALVDQVRNSGRISVLGDQSQQIYKREAFDIPDAVKMDCNDNFRSPVELVNDINRFMLTREPVVARSGWQGVPPTYHTHPPGERASIKQIEVCVKALLSEGYMPDQIALVSFSGVKNSRLLAQDSVAGIALKKPTGAYDAAGNALWTEGSLLADSVYRFKGQSAPVVVFCEIDFEELDDRTKAKLFVGMTRAQVRLEVVATEAAGNGLLGAL